MMEALSDAAFEAVFLHRDGVIQSANRAAHELAAVPPGGLIGQRLLDYIPTSERPKVLAKVGTGDHEPYESELLTRGGEHIPVEVRGRMVPVQLEGGPARVVALRDLREKRELEEQIRNAQKMEVVGRLAGSIAHDFNNVLTVILGGLDLLARDIPEESPRRRLIGPIRDSAQSAAELTKQLLTLARRQVVRTRVVDLGPLLNSLLPMLRRAVGEHVSVEIGQAADARVVADPMQIEMMLLNLAVNARDAMPEGGRLRVDVETTDATERLEERGQTGPAAPHVCLTVTDTGRGMDAAIRERVFEPFFTSKPVGEGTGLGLATVASIVEQMGGAIWVDSEPGRGAAFVMVFERTDDVVEEAPEPEPERASTGQGQHVLVVEDQENVRRVVRQVLEAAGYELTTKSGPRAALRWAETADQPPELVLTDVVMPGMNGVTMVAQLRQRWPSVPALFMSGYDPEGLASRARGLEHSHFVSKPLAAEALISAIEACLDPAPNGASGD